MTWVAQSAFQYDYQATSLPTILGAAALGFLTYLVTFAFSAIAQGALTRATIAHSHGRKASIGECMAAAFPVALPLFGFSLLWLLGIMVAALFLLVPAIILACMWAVSVLAMVEERIGVFAAFGRSRALTRGYRWRVFAVQLILIVAYYLLMALMGSLSAQSFSTDPETMPALTPGFIIMNLVSSTLFSAVWGDACAFHVRRPARCQGRREQREFGRGVLIGPGERSPRTPDGNAGGCSPP